MIIVAVFPETCESRCIVGFSTDWRSERREVEMLDIDVLAELLDGRKSTVARAPLAFVGTQFWLKVESCGASTVGPQRRYERLRLSYGLRYRGCVGQNRRRRG